VSLPVTNYIDNSGNQPTPSGLVLPQDLNTIFIPHTGLYNFTNSYSRLKNATGYVYKSGGSYVDISNIFDISTNPTSYSNNSFLIGYKIPYGVAGTLTDLGSIFALKPSRVSWLKFVQAPSSYPNGSTFSYNSIAMDSTGQYLIAVTDDGYIWNSNCYGYDPASPGGNSAWTKYKAPFLSTYTPPSNTYIWSGCTMDSTGQYQAVFFSVKYINAFTGVIGADYGTSWVYYNNNYGDQNSWVSLYASSIVNQSTVVNFGNFYQTNSPENAYSAKAGGCTFLNMDMSSDGDTLSLSTNVTPNNVAPASSTSSNVPQRFSTVYTYTSLTTGNRYFNQTTGTSAVQNSIGVTPVYGKGPKPSTTGSLVGSHGAPINGCCGFIGAAMNYAITMNGNGQKILGNPSLYSMDSNGNFNLSGQYYGISWYSDYAQTDPNGNTYFPPSVSQFSYGLGYVFASKNPTYNGDTVQIIYSDNSIVKYAKVTLNTNQTYSSVSTLMNNKTTSVCMTSDFDNSSKSGILFAVKGADDTSPMYRYNASTSLAKTISPTNFVNSSGTQVSNIRFATNTNNIANFSSAQCQNNAICCSSDGSYVAFATVGNGIFVCSTGLTIV